ncbi:hypothetical protein [Motiliproteus sp. SC1-56]|uniref:hypothetical protein n=1 Tax=Motiliproteus sp. SC1-56 TaxID=2799565 RepID=UPI001A8E3FBA|nr:hypothetical protein [Motiliproteus sp. SC1-56]
MAAHVMIHIRPQDLPPEGLRVLYRCGENYDGTIEWGDTQEGTLTLHLGCNDLREDGINIDDQSTPGYAGFETRTGTYWRYAHESDPDVFREHCMQIIEILESFTPRSSWEAWKPISQTLGHDRIRLTLKNGVTGSELSYKVVNKGFGYQIKDLNNGRRVQKLLKHDYILNRLMGTSYKKLNHHKIKIETEAPVDGDAGGSICLQFLAEGLMLKYQLNLYEFALGLFKTQGDELELIKLVELPHSSVIEDTRSFLG